MTNHLAWINEVKPSVNSWEKPQTHGALKRKEKLWEEWTNKDHYIKDIVKKEEYGMVRKMHRSLAEMKGKWVDDW